MSSFLAHINIMPLEGTPEPQGEAALEKLADLGVEGLGEIRIGRHLTIQLYAKTMNEAHKKVEAACQKLLANEASEQYDFVVEELD